MENKNEKTQFSRFQIFIGEKQTDGTIKKTKNVGMSYLGEGQNIFSVRLWTFSWERFFILPDKKNSSKYLVMTREPNKNPNSKNKYYWNIVGNASADSKNGVIQIEFDLIEKPIYMNMFPETSPYSKNVPEPEQYQEVA